MRRLAVLLLLMASIGCIQTGDKGVRATLSTATATVHRDHIGVGATVSVAKAAIWDVKLRIRFRDGADVVREEEDVLPFCSARLDPCHWGASFVIDSPAERNVDRVEVDIRGYRDKADNDGLPDLVPLRAKEQEGSIELVLAQEAGRGILVALEAGQPVYGITFDAEEKDDDLKIPSSDLPEHDDIDVRFYPGANESNAD
jgi:hypothetical protein